MRVGVCVSQSVVLLQPTPSLTDFAFLQVRLPAAVAAAAAAAADLPAATACVLGLMLSIQRFYWPLTGEKATSGWLSLSW